MPKIAIRFSQYCGLLDIIIVVFLTLKAGRVKYGQNE